MLGAGAGAGTGAGNTWETVAEEVDMADLVATIGNNCTAYLNTKYFCPSPNIFAEACYSVGDAERPERLLCGAVKTLRSSRAKPDPVSDTSTPVLLDICAEMLTKYHSYDR